MNDPLEYFQPYYKYLRCELYNLSGYWIEKKKHSKNKVNIIYKLKYNKK